MYQFILNDNAKEESKSISGIVVRKDIWSKQFTDKPKQLKNHLRTRSNLNGIVDFKYSTNKGQDVIYYSKDDLENNVILFHKTEFGNMSSKELFKLAEAYDIRYSPLMKQEFLIQSILEAQGKYEEEIGVEEATKRYSEYRRYILGIDKKEVKVESVSSDAETEDDDASRVD